VAISTNGNYSFSRRRFHGAGALSEINVTPFVDVMLVLLIIFMLTAHVMEFGIEVDVPKVRQVRDSTQELPVVTITKEGGVFLNEREVNVNLIPAELQKRFGAAQSVYVRADKETVWNVIAQVISELNTAKIGVNVVTQPEDTTGKGPK
jgi:biopolymer transport protein ExbD